jgi:hypothetical protein
MPLSSWNYVLEADLGFKLPNNTRLFYGKKPPINRRSSWEVNPLHRRERLELFRNIEGFLDVYVLKFFSTVYFCVFGSENV